MGWMYITYVTVCIGGRTCQLRLTASQSQNMRDIFKLEHQCVLSPPRFLIKIFLLRGCQVIQKFTWITIPQINSVPFSSLAGTFRLQLPMSKPSSKKSGSASVEENTCVSHRSNCEQTDLPNRLGAAIEVRVMPGDAGLVVGFIFRLHCKYARSHI